MMTLRSFKILLATAMGSILLSTTANAQLIDASTLSDKDLAAQALAAIGANVPNSTHKCAGCHGLDALNLRRWADTTARVKDECFAHFEEAKSKETAEGSLRCMSGNVPNAFPWRAKHLGLWAGRTQSADFNEVFEAYFGSSAASELDTFKMMVFMPRSGGPGFDDGAWNVIQEWVSRGAPQLEETLGGQSITDTPATPAAIEDKVVINNLDRPWAVVQSPNNDIWVTEIGGKIKIFNTQFQLQKTFSGFPAIRPTGQGGLLDLVFHPNFLQNGWVYASYTVQSSEGALTRINRFTYRDGQLTEHKIILNGPTGTDGAHFGSRMVFGTDGKLYATFGERHQKEKAQSLNSLHGKIVRINDDGSIPEDNPFGAENPIYTLGHRNPQGIALQPGTGRLVNSEHGPTGYDAPGGGDEVNILKAGGNYGWPNLHHTLTGEGFESPLKEYTPAIAPSGVTFYTGDKIPQWKNDFFMTGLRGARLVRLRINNEGRVTEDENLYVGKYGRIRDVGNSPDGSLLLVTDDGRMVRISAR